MSRHTPGPWHIDGTKALGPYGVWADKPSGDDRPAEYGQVCSFWSGPMNPLGDMPTREANACLIAAAPDLLNACVAMLATWGSDDEDAIIAARDAARAAVSRATEGGAA